MRKTKWEVRGTCKGAGSGLARIVGRSPRDRVKRYGWPFLARPLATSMQPNTPKLVIGRRLAIQPNTPKVSLVCVAQAHRWTEKAYVWFVVVKFNLCHIEYLDTCIEY